MSRMKLRAGKRGRMRPMESPRIPKWLLRAFGCSPNNAVVIGDLDEHFRQGRSRAWYWNQAVKALASGFVQEVRGHKLFAARAIVTGWLLLFVGMGLFSAVIRSLNAVMRLDSTWVSVGFSQWLRHALSVHPQLSIMALALVSGSAWAGIGWAV